MTTPASRIRLVTEAGRRVVRVPKAKRIAAQPGVDVARLSRSMAEIYAEGCRVLALAMEAEEVSNLAFAATCRRDRLTGTALTREMNISTAYLACRISNLLVMMEQASEGRSCA